MAGVELREISKSFGSAEILKHVSLDVASGEFISLVGPSGCGKTTLMRIIAGLETVSAGRVRIGGDDVTDIRAADRDVAMVFQNYALYPHLTVHQNIAVPLVMRRMSALQRAPLLGRFVPGSTELSRAIAADVALTAEMLGIGPYLDRKPSQLSGGQRQRVALGRAIVRRPQAFLMDEPLSNLDAALRVSTRAEIVALHRRVGASTVYVTHDQSEAMTMSDRVAVMMAGEILQVGTPEEVYDNPCDLRVAKFIGSPAINALPGEVDEHGEVSVAGVRIGVASAYRGPVTVAVRPEDIAPGPEGVACRIAHVEFLGDSLLVHAREIDSGAAVLCRLPSERRGEAQLGSTISMRPMPRKVMLFDVSGLRVKTAAAHRAERAHG